MLNNAVYGKNPDNLRNKIETRDNGVSITEILKTGFWKSENTFRKFYSRDIIKQNSSEEFDFVQLLLSSSEKINDTE